MSDSPAPTFGLCMIVKNGAHMLPRILDKVKPANALYSGNNPAFHQVVILDTGSTDGTVQMLKERYPWVEVHETTWKFDFSIARNEALSYMNTDVWMWLDADDTFSDATLRRWFEIAQEFWENRDEPGHPVYALIPYIYKVDKNDLPLVVHFRERILLGKDWEWREPLHEVCHYTGDGGRYDAYNDCPVVHRPTGEVADERENHNRNWKIMMHHYLSGSRSDRTLYYLARMAVVERQYEFAIQIALELIGRNAGGYYEYESSVAAGESYFELYKRDSIDEYKEKAIEYLTTAKRYEPQRNEARAKLCDLYIHCNMAEEALREALAMNEAMPATVATTLPAQYGKYKYTVLSMIYFRMIGNIWNAMVNHMKALDCPRPHGLSMQMDGTIKTYLRDQKIGIMYCDEKYNGHAMVVRDILRKHHGYGDVLIFNDPHCIAYAEGFYFHFTEKEDTLYREDGHPRLRKVLFSPYAHEWSLPFGYERMFDIPVNPLHAKTLIDDVYEDCPVRRLESLQGMLDDAMQGRTNKVCYSTTIENDEGIAELERNDPTKRGTLRFVVNVSGELLGVTGWTDDIVSFYVDRKGILRAYNIEAITIEASKLLDGIDEALPGLRWRVEQAPYSGKTVVIVAPGIEDWNGTTPRRWGIGASESCVIYMAEEMRKRGHKVTVYAPVVQSSIVAGVEYLHISQYFTGPVLPDLYVASRVPEWLEGPRRGKMQVLWMHDIPDAYIRRITQTQIIDRYVTISRWQEKRSVKMNFRSTKMRHIPNGLVNWPDYHGERVPGRMIWVSQPERGIDNMHLFWQKKPEWFTDFWIVYGFYNLLNYAQGNIGMTEESFQDTARYKFAMRQMGAKIVGRIPHWQVQKLAQTCERWLYPSVFPETFCVAGLEALHNGVQCFYTHNGATAETLNLAKADEFTRKVCIGQPLTIDITTPMQDSFEFDRDHQRWIDAVDKHAGLNESIGLDDPYYYWERVGDEWESLINGS